MLTPARAGSCDWFAGELVKCFLFTPEEIAEAVAALRRTKPHADSFDLGEYLVSAGRLTQYQRNRVLDGNGRGLVLGPYVVTDTLGVGSLGTVYLAIGKADRAIYVVKLLPERCPITAREARRTAMAFPSESHPAVVPFLDAGTAPGGQYLVWPYVEGVSLAERVERSGPLSPAEAVRTAWQLSGALQFFERHGLLHGAVQPSNVLLGTDGHAKFLDSGLGAMIADGGEHSVIDTMSVACSNGRRLDYSAPEVLIDPMKRSVHSDQYSLGCTLYFALTGRPPFPEGTVVEKIAAHQSTEPVPLRALNRAVTPDLDAIVDRLMHKSPGGRFATTEDLLGALLPLARAAGINAAALPPVARPSGIHGTSKLLSSSRLAVPTDGGRKPSVLLSGLDRPAAPARTPAPSGLPDVRPTVMSTPTAKQTLSPMTTPLVPAPSPFAAMPTRTAPPAVPVWRQVLNGLTFWKASQDPVEVTLLVPSGVLPGDRVMIQVVAHHARIGPQARQLTDWRGTQALPVPIARGAILDLHLNLLNVAADAELKQVTWVGNSEATTFTVKLPRDWPSGRAAEGVLTVGANRTPMARLMFSIPVVAAQVPGGVLSQRF